MNRRRSRQPVSTGSSSAHCSSLTSVRYALRSPMPQGYDHPPPASTDQRETPHIRQGQDTVITPTRRSLSWTTCLSHPANRRPPSRFSHIRPRDDISAARLDYGGEFRLPLRLTTGALARCESRDSFADGG